MTSFSPWHLDKGGPESIDRYDYHFFVSYNRADTSVAREIAMSLVDRRYRVFFAPESLAYYNTSNRPDSNFWSSILQPALLGSCHFIGIASQPYMTSDWAGGLEMMGFLNIHAVNASRKISLVIDPKDPPREAALAVYAMPRDEVIAWAEACGRSQPFDLGDDREPKTCFDLLPLHEMTISRGWDDTPLHHRIEPDYREFESCVREIMMIIRCGGTDEHIMARYTGSARWTQWDVENALKDARHLLKLGISPYTLSAAREQI